MKKHAENTTEPGNEANTMLAPVYYIYVYYKVGNIGSDDVKVLSGQPESGFKTEKQAETYLKKLILAKKGYYFDRAWYKFTILKTWNSLSAV